VKILVSAVLGLLLLLGSLLPYSRIPSAKGQDDNTSTQEASADDSDDEDDNDSFQDRLGAAREARKRAFEEAKQRRQEASEEAKTRREEAREEFKLRLKEIKDERKAKIVENLDERLANRNEKWIRHFNRVLTRLSQIIAKIKIRAEELAGEGTDVSEVNAQVAEAEAAIEVAQEAVNAQALKVYTIEITDEDSLGDAVSEVIGEFKDDIKAVWEKVREARRQVVEAFVALKRAAGEPDEDRDEQEETSPSPLPSPSPTEVPSPTPI